MFGSRVLATLWNQLANCSCVVTDSTRNPALNRALLNVAPVKYVK
jgi:hypothetical protein